MERKRILLILFLLSLQIVNGIDIEDFADSYDFTYSSSDFSLDLISVSQENDNLTILLNVSSKNQNYTFLSNLKSLNTDTKMSQIKIEKLNFGYNLVKLYLNTKYLKNGDYMLGLEVSNDELIIFRDLNFEQIEVNNLDNRYLKLLNTNYIQTKNSSILDLELENIPKNISQIFIIIGDIKNNLYQFNAIANSTSQILFELNSSKLIKNNLSKIFLKNIVFICNNIQYTISENIIFYNDLSLFENLEKSQNNDDNLTFSNNEFVDLEVLDLDYNKSSGNLNFTLKNSGNVDAVRFTMKIIDEDFNILEERLFNYLFANESLNLDYKIPINLTQFYLFVDYYSQIDEINKENNVAYWPIKEIKKNINVENTSLISNKKTDDNSNKINSGGSGGGGGGISRALKINSNDEIENRQIITDKKSRVDFIEDNNTNINITTNYNYTLNSQINKSDIQKISNNKREFISKLKSIKISSDTDWESINKSYFAINNLLFSQFPLNLFNYSKFIKSGIYSFEFGLMCIDLDLFYRGWFLE